MVHTEWLVPWHSVTDFVDLAFILILILILILLTLTRLCKGVGHGRENEGPQHNTCTIPTLY